MKFIEAEAAAVKVDASRTKITGIAKNGSFILVDRMDNCMWYAMLFWPCSKPMWKNVL